MSLSSHWLSPSPQLIGSYFEADAHFLTQMQTPPRTRSIMGVPKPTAIMMRTTGEKESMGGVPTPSNTVLKGERRLVRER